MKRIQSKKHKLGTYEIDKISLSCFDDKRYMLDDEIHTLSYFLKDRTYKLQVVRDSKKESEKNCDKKDCDKKDCKKTSC